MEAYGCGFDFDQPPVTERTSHEPVTERSRSDQFPRVGRSHKIHEEEVQAGSWKKKKTGNKDYKKPSKTNDKANGSEGEYGGQFDGVE